MSKNRGFIVNLIVVVVALIILNYYFGDKLREILFSEKTRQFLADIWYTITHIWNTYLHTPLKDVWEKVVLGIIWPTIQSIISKAKQN